MTDSRERGTSDPLAYPEEALATLESRPAVAELARSLRALPDIEPDPAVWARIQAETARSVSPATGSEPRVSERAGEAQPLPSTGGRDPSAPFASAFAMAAGLILTVAAGILFVQVLQEGDSALVPGDLEIALQPVDGSANQSALQILRERSRQLEPLALATGADPVATAFRYRIADVDAQLGGLPEDRQSQPEVQRLWGQRVALLESLAEVRRARAAMQPAVY